RLTKELSISTKSITWKKQFEKLQATDSFFDSIHGASGYQKVSEIAVDTQRRLDLLEIAAPLSPSAKQGQSLPDSITPGPETFTTDPTTGQAYSYRKTGAGVTVSSDRKDGTDAT
ncbi:MAG: hypothetical protein ACI9A1_000522, partial [Lentimonas sp.]